MNLHKRTLPKSLHRLSELASNAWFSWNEEATRLFSDSHPYLWEQTGHNPAQWLLEIEEPLLQQLSLDSSFLAAYQHVIKKLDHYLNQRTWFQRNYPEHNHVQIAYFSAEFGFHESLPIYSGGLGILAGDHCKSASDLGIPLVGIGLLYRKGYFKQKIDSNGNQQAEQLVYDLTKLPIQPVLINGQEVIIGIEMPGRSVALRVWVLQVGRNPLYLLDADVESNSESDRQLTAQLYGGNQETRIQQEIVLGIGGIKALRALGLFPTVYHINEGHSAFLTLECLKELIHKGLPFHAALEAVRAATVFTTHTPVPAGHDAFSPGMVEHHLSPLFAEIGGYRQELIELGLDKRTGLFNMTHLALNTSALRNGVSKLHGAVSREMFRSFHGSIESHQVPIQSITNGVHMETWLAAEWKKLFDQYLPDSWREEQIHAENWSSMDVVPHEDIWGVRVKMKEQMILQARRILQEQRRRNGESQERIDEVNSYLSPQALTIGFARRFATYKRANLIFSDLKRLKRILHHSERPVQIIFAGKAHPADYPGQELIREIYRISQIKEFAGKIVILENYDMSLARCLVQGVDVWLNNPQRPLEASGTSGQKAAMNGVLNFSVLDGWWEEGYNGTNGWAISSTYTESIYRILEEEIIPLYYEQGDQGDLPIRWINRIKNSIQTISPEYNTHRMVRDYTQKAYLPAAERALRFAKNGYNIAIKVADYKKFMNSNWHHVKIITVDDQSASLYAVQRETNKMNENKEVTADISFGPVWFLDTVVEIVYYESNNEGWEQVIVPMKTAGEADQPIQRYTASIPSHLLHGPHFSVRVRPVSANFSHSFELPLMTTTLLK
jgi:starch phosphorylase